jgi:hypothetical protein
MRTYPLACQVLPWAVDLGRLFRPGPFRLGEGSKTAGFNPAIRADSVD